MIVETAIVREVDVETIISPTATGRLLLDSSDTGGALSTVRMTLAEGADGAVPHHHATSTELFYVLEGKARVLSGEEVVTLVAGDVAAVPPRRQPFHPLRRGVRTPATREILEHPAAPLTAANLARLGEGLLRDTGFEPTFALDPALRAVLDTALIVVERDVRAAGITGAPADHP
ncbi:hypothetical protein GCM10010404_79350 [Nonomuraea africana]